MASTGAAQLLRAKVRLTHVNPSLATCKRASGPTTPFSTRTMGLRVGRVAFANMAPGYTVFCCGTTDGTAVLTGGGESADKLLATSCRLSVLAALRAVAGELRGALQNMRSQLACGRDGKAQSSRHWCGARPAAARAAPHTLQFCC